MGVFGFLEFGGKPHFEVLKGKKHLIICQGLGLWILSNNYQSEGHSYPHMHSRENAMPLVNQGRLG
jgi:hypothetical protein